MKVYTHHNPKDPSQHMIFMTMSSPELIKVTYQMGEATSPHTQIIVKVANGLSLDMFHSQCYDLRIEDARVIWNYLTEELTWTDHPLSPTRSTS